MLCPLPAGVVPPEQAGSRSRWSSGVHSPVSLAPPAALTTPLDHWTQIQFPDAVPEAESSKAAQGQLLDALLTPLDTQLPSGESIWQTSGQTLRPCVSVMGGQMFVELHSLSTAIMELKFQT